jgi:hypothetical protein
VSPTFELAERVADAVLYEGYMLYPYRASAVKNRFRWQFGVVAPRAPQEGGDPWFAQTECLVKGAARLAVRVRYLRPRPSETAHGKEWLDSEARWLDLAPIDLGETPFSQVLPLEGSDIQAQLTIEAQRTGGICKVRLRLENMEPWHPRFAANRNELLCRSMAAAHLLLAVEGGSFVSLLDPPADVAALAATCESRHAWPVLIGDPSTSNLMLSAPIILYDFPVTAKASRNNLCDATEIDEILSLRILTLTDEEKAEARADDPRARAILDGVQALTPDAFAELHGTIRAADFFNPAGTPPPEQAFAVVDGQRVGKGSHVRLRPNRRADAMDIFLADQTATIAGVYTDVEDRVYVAVTVDADPAASLHDAFGRHFYFDPTELELLQPGQECV